MSTELTTNNRSIFLPNDWEHALEMSIALIQSDIVPDIYKRSKKGEFSAKANCLIALNMAKRMQADPLMVMQNLYIVNGRPGWSSKFLIGAFNRLGQYSSIEYEFEGIINTDQYGCRAFATELATKKILKGTLITIGMAKKEGWFGKKDSKWQTMPEQMLRYRAASFFINAFAPEITCGFMTQEEVEDMRDISPSNGFEDTPLPRHRTKVKGITEKTITPLEESVPVKSEKPTLELSPNETIKQTQ